jgi:hypothetical protein
MRCCPNPETAVSMRLPTCILNRMHAYMHAHALNSPKSSTIQPASSLTATTNTASDLKWPMVTGTAAIHAVLQSPVMKQTNTGTPCNTMQYKQRTTAQTPLGVNPASCTRSQCSAHKGYCSSLQVALARTTVAPRNRAVK